MHLKLLILIITTLSSVCFSQDSVERLPHWWDARWKYRQSFIVKDPGLANKINTASLTIDTLAKCSPGGEDIRVLDDQLNIVPHHVLSEKNGIVQLDIELKTTEPKGYFVYYGNPHAEGAEHNWDRRLGGLYLEVKGLNVNAGLNMYPSNLEEAQKLIKASAKSFGKKLWDKIDDAANPFAPQQDFYISIYTGDLFCPETGEYTFATNSDDASFMLVNGQEVASWPVGHVQSVDWLGEEEGRTSRTISLQKGIYKIEYYHVEDQGGQLARAGWKRPSDKFFSVIPPEFFIRKLKAEVIGYQEYKRPLNAYFTFREGKSIQISDADQLDASSSMATPLFTTMFFKDCSVACLGELVLWHWNLGDGDVSSERNPSHEYRGAGRYSVSLFVKDNLGFSSKVAREVEIKGHAKESVKVKLFLDISTKQSILDHNEPLHLELKVRSSAPESIKLSLISELRDSKELLIEKTIEGLDLRQDKWYPILKTYDCVTSSQLALSRSELSFTLAYNGAPIAGRTAIVALASDAPPALKVKNASLITSSFVAQPFTSFEDRASSPRAAYKSAPIPSSSSYSSQRPAVAEHEKVVVLRTSDPAHRRLSNGWLALPTFKVVPPAAKDQTDSSRASSQPSARIARTLKIVFLDDSETPRSTGETRKSSRKTYHDFLAEMLMERYPGATITMGCAGIPQEASSFPRLARISKISSEVIPAKPDLVIIPCSTNDILYHLPIDDYKKFLAVAIEMISGRCSAEVLLVTPAPLISDIHLSYDYALATKEVAQERGIPVADVYSAFYNMGKKWKELYQGEMRPPGKGNPIFYLHPNTRGQKRIATEIFEEIVR